MTEQQGKGGDHLSFFLPLPPAHEHSEILFLTTQLVITKLLREEINHLGELPFGSLIDDVDGMFYSLDYFILHFGSTLTRESGRLCTRMDYHLALQAN